MGRKITDSWDDKVVKCHIRGVPTSLMRIEQAAYTATTIAPAAICISTRLQGAPSAPPC